MANQLIHSKIYQIFDKFVKAYKVRPSIIGSILLSVPNEIKKKFEIDVNVEENFDLYENVIKFIEERKISRSSVPEIIYYAKKEGKDINAIIDEKNLRIATKDEISNAVREIIEKDKGLIANKQRLKGIIMGKFKGRANIEDVEEILNELK